MLTPVCKLRQLCNIPQNVQSSAISAIFVLHLSCVSNILSCHAFAQASCVLYIVVPILIVYFSLFVIMFYIINLFNAIASEFRYV